MSFKFYTTRTTGSYKDTSHSESKTPQVLAQDGPVECRGRVPTHVLFFRRSRLRNGRPPAVFRCFPPSPGVPESLGSRSGSELGSEGVGRTRREIESPGRDGIPGGRSGRGRLRHERGLDVDRRRTTGWIRSVSLEPPSLRTVGREVSVQSQSSLEFPRSLP